jgi:hypothetical protein
VWYSVSMMNAIVVMVLAAGAVNFEQSPAERMKSLAAKHPAVARAATLTTSSGGVEIPILTLGTAAADKVQPEILIVAGLDGRHAVGVETAARVAETLAAEPPAWLGEVRVHVVTCANPDAFAAKGQAVEFGRLRRPGDADRDRRLGEDPAEDLNGDGMISLMRVRDPKPGSGLTAAWVDDPEWPGLMRKPDAGQGERAAWAVLTEGIDNDGDGKYNEDGPGPEGFDGFGGAGGGLDVDRNFPMFWPEFEDGAGTRPLEVPETRGLAEWCLARPGLIAVVVFGRHDTIVNIPEAGKFDASGRVPTGILNEDKGLYEAWSKAYKDATGLAEAGRMGMEGSFAGWVYGTLGVPTVATPVWVRPDQMSEAKRPKPAAKEEPTGEEKKEEGAKDEPKKDEPKKPEAKTDEQRWARFFADFGVEGLVAWKAFEHPTLGPVEIGGFRPGARTNPPAALGVEKELAAGHAAFLAEIAAQRPELKLDVTVERAGAGLWTVRARVTNTGRLATVSVMGARARVIPPTTLTIGVEDAAIVSGTKRASAERIEGLGGTLDAAWTILAKDGGAVTVTMGSPLTGPIEARAELR